MVFMEVEKMKTSQIINLANDQLLKDYNDAVRAVENVVLERFKEGHPCVQRTWDGEDIVYFAKWYKKARKPNINFKFPVGFVFIRGDRGGGGKVLAEEVTSSLRYWHLDSDRYIDFIFPGWRKPYLHEKETNMPYVDLDSGSPLVFDIELFSKMRQSIEKQSRWRYSGETDILLVNYMLNPAYAWGTLQRKSTSYYGHLDFREAITLYVEQMIKKKLTLSIDALMHEIISASKLIERPGVWEISDRIGYQRGSKALWTFLKRMFARKLTDVLDEVQPFAVHNLRK